MDQCRHRRRAFHRIWQPHIQGELRRLAAGADEQEQARCRNPWIADEKLSTARDRVDLRVLNRAEIPRNAEQSQQETCVTHAVDDERLIRCGRRRVPQEIEADQQVRAQTHALPADKHQRIIVRQDERQHREHEQVEVAEESVITALVCHVAYRVDVDEHAHAGHEQQPDRRQRIEQEAGVGAKWRGLSAVHHVAQAAIARAQPGKHHLLKRLAGSRRRISRVLPYCETRPGEGQHHHAHANAVHRRLGQLASKEKHASRADRGKQRNQPDVVKKIHCQLTKVEPTFRSASTALLYVRGFSPGYSSNGTAAAADEYG